MRKLHTKLSTTISSNLCKFLMSLCSIALTSDFLHDPPWNANVWKREAHFACWPAQNIICVFRHVHQSVYSTQDISHRNEPKTHSKKLNTCVIFQYQSFSLIWILKKTTGICRENYELYRDYIDIFHCHSLQASGNLFTEAYWKWFQWTELLCLSPSYLELKNAVSCFI